MKVSIYILLFFFSFLLISCEKDNKYDPDEAHPVQKEKINGFVQKGPFINGTSITISELTPNLVQTGKTFSTQLSDNKGSFEFKQVELSSQFVEMKADGFYFNEITGERSSAQLTLYALSDITDKSSLNVNILSHLEKARIDFLVSNGTSFNEAKKKAQKEILEIFSIDKTDIMESEMLDISKEGEDNAILLAISVIIQGYRTEAELSELIANISTDIREDGILNSTTLGSELINHAQLMNLSGIRENLTNRYRDMGLEASIPNFEKYVQIFRENTDYEYTGLIDYPEFGEHGENILFADRTEIKTFTSYSMAAGLPAGAHLKIIMKGGLWYYEFAPNGPKNWTSSTYNRNDESQIFTSIETGKECDLKIGFEITDKYIGDSTIFAKDIKYDTITIDYYENWSELPTRTKKIILEYYAPWEE